MHGPSLCRPGSCASRPKRPRLETLPESKTVNKLLSLIGRGRSHCSTACDVAAAVRDDGVGKTAVSALASCGSGGAHPGNVERDLHRWVRGLRGLLLEPYELTLDLEDFRLKMAGLSRSNLFDPIFQGPLR